MTLTVCGINHHTAPLALRERLAFVPAEIPLSLACLQQERELSEVVLLSTCNRTEIYFPDHYPASFLQDWLIAHKQVNADALAPHWYEKTGEAAVQHLLRVASGLDSQLLGEPEIFGQVKRAYEMAVAAGLIGSAFHRLFQHVFHSVKILRTETDIGVNPLSTASVTSELLKSRFPDFKKTRGLLIGSGEINIAIAQYLAKFGLGELICANRTVDRVVAWPETCNQRTVGIHELSHYLGEVDFVVAATACPVVILTAVMVKQAVHRPILLIDLAVPRDIAPEVGHLPNVELLTIDDLQSLSEENRGLRQAAAVLAETRITDYVQAYSKLAEQTHHTRTIAAFREQAHSFREQELRQALQKIQQGQDAESVLAEFSHRLTNKLLHLPTRLLKETSRVISFEDHLLPEH